MAGYRTPVDNLYLCGAGTHPGGEVTGAPGHNAAHAVLQRLGASVGGGSDGAWRRLRRADVSYSFSEQGFVR